MKAVETNEKLIMLERPKGDATSSSSTIPTPARVVKNPLLSASVTGLTFEDFPNKPHLLPAAPPILHSSQSTPTIAAININREPKSLVTVGHTSSIDNETLSEINLNYQADKSEPAQIDTNCNTLVDNFTESNNDSILSQAATSFSSLPSVASSVFSTFSKRINLGSSNSSRERTPVSENTQLPPYQQDQFQQQSAQAPTTWSATLPPTAFAGGNYFEAPAQPVPASLTQPAQEFTEQSAEPPKFYIPSELETSKPGVDASSGASAAKNSYRLTAKKKIYAPIPGFGETHAASATLDPTAIGAPIVFENYQAQSNSYGYPQVDPFHQTHQKEQPVYQHKPEERNSKIGGFFSITNLVPTEVFQNISGLVQSAAGSIVQTVKSDAKQVQEAQPSQSAVDVNYFGPLGKEPPVGTIRPSPFYSATDESANFAAPPSIFIPTETHFQNTPPAAGVFGALPPSTIVAGPPPPAGVFGAQPASTTVSAPPPAAGVFGALPPSTTVAGPPPPAGVFGAQPASTTVSAPPPAAGVFSALPPSTTVVAPPPPAGVFGAQQASTTVSAPPPAPGVFDAIPSSTTLTAPPQATAAVFGTLPTSTSVAPPPPAGTASTFRLQKGARVYKSPLSSAEIAPTYDERLLNQSLLANQIVPQTILNPFGTAPATFDRVELVASASGLQNPSSLVESLELHPPINLTSAAEIVNPTVPELFPTDPIAAASNIFNDIPSQSSSVLNLFNPTSSVDQSSCFITPTTNVKSSDESIQADSVCLSNKIVSVEQSPALHIPESYPPVAEDNKPIKSTETTETLINPQTDSQSLGQVVSEAENSLAQINNIPPPPQFSAAQDSARNLYRKEPNSKAVPQTSLGQVQPSLANFFTPTLSDNLSTVDNLNTFSAQTSFSNNQNSVSNSNSTKYFDDLSQTLQPIPQEVAITTLTPSESSTELNVGCSSTIEPITATDICPLILKPNNVATPLNSLSNFFTNSNTTNSNTSSDTTSNPAQQLSDSTSFFDTFASEQNTASFVCQPTVTTTNSPQQQINEDQRIQNFFNNSPLQEVDAVVEDLNYDLVHSGLKVNTLQTRSLTPASNIVEPPSSSCSELSELQSSLRQTQTGESSAKTTPEENASLTDKTDITAPNETIDSKAVDLTKHYEDLPEEVLQILRMANTSNSEKGATATPPITSYTPAIKHWFFKRLVGTKVHWTPFSHYDSALLETNLTLDDAPNIVAVEGGRYDVNILERTKTPVYWESESIEVKRCSWFYKAVDSRYVPYEEETADLLEAEYRVAFQSGEWHKKIILSMGEQVVFHGPTVIVHFQQQQSVDTWGGTTQTTTRPRVVKRDLDDFTINQGEAQRIDHLLFMVHGIGSACDLKMRSVEEVVDEFRTISQQLVQSHYKNSTDMGIVGRVEVLPISWHSHLHSEEMGIDEKLKSITLESIPKLRNFTNDTLLDVLFYTSPTYCQKIMNTVAVSMNTVYMKYRERHPEFNGGVSLAGHSLGSLILFDLLCHQNPVKDCEELNMENPDEQFPHTTSLDSNVASGTRNDEVAAKQISYTMGPAGTGQPFINYAQLTFQPKKFFALGSPIGMFVTIRGIDNLGLDFRLPTCPGFYNIFHPFDPVAYRIEALINPDMSGIRPVLIPHHKGRKRMHLELKETMTRVGADLKQRFLDTFKNTFESVNFLGTSLSRPANEKETTELMEKEVDQVLQLQMQLDQQQATTSRTRTDSMSTTHSDTDLGEVDLPLGKLNDSKRVDYVLQEAPLEFFNEYLFALSSHVCYWDSEDTILFVMKEIYSGIGISPDSQVPQQTMTIERPAVSSDTTNTLLRPQ